MKSTAVPNLYNMVTVRMKEIIKEADFINRALNRQQLGPKVHFASQ